MKWIIRCVAGLCLGLFSVQAAETNLKEMAVRDASGNIAVLSSGVYADYPAAASFDGNLATYADLQSQGGWGGYSVTNLVSPTRIRYYARTIQLGRAVNVQFQGANKPDFSDARLLGVVTSTPPANTWCELIVTNNAIPCTYFRFYAPVDGSFGGNLCEVEFYGIALAYQEGVQIPAPTFCAWINGTFNLRINVQNGESTCFEIQRKRDDDLVWTNCGLFTVSAPSQNNVFTDKITVYSPTQYRMRSCSNTVFSAWTNLTTLTPIASLTGTWIGTPGAYVVGDDGTKTYDGNIKTFFDGPAKTNDMTQPLYATIWTGLDLGKTTAVAQIRFVPRLAWASRQVGCWFEAANTADFSDAVVVYTNTALVLDTSVTTLPLNATNAYRYVRYCVKGVQWGSIAEVEFDTVPDAIPAAPTSLDAQLIDATNLHVRLSWSYAAARPVTGWNVYCATSAGGPFVKMNAEPCVERSYVHSNALAGVTYYYSVTAVNGALEGPSASQVGVQPITRLERSWSDLTKIKSNMALIGTTNSYWYPVSYMFDNSRTTFADINNKNPCIGVDLAKAYVIRKARYYPRANLVYRLQGAELRGSNSATLDTYEVLAKFPATITTNDYSELTLTATTPYRYIYVTRPDSGEFYGNISELELYGWDPDGFASIPIAPRELAFAQEADGTLTISWSNDMNCVSFDVQRKGLDDTEWSTLGTTHAHQFNDATATLNTLYQYRIVGYSSTAVSGYSIVRSCSRYQPGSGTGLRTQYTVPYFRDGAAYTQGTVVASADVPSVQWSWGSGEPCLSGMMQSTTQTLISCYGNLIVPVSGDYIFQVVSSNSVALQIDGAFVINQWSHGSKSVCATNTLTAGEHRIRLDYHRSIAGPGLIRLEWGGAVGAGVIPASQLIPLAFPSEVYQGWQGHSFAANYLGTHQFNADGSLTIGVKGYDFSGNEEGYYFVWQRISGDFVVQAKIAPIYDAAASSAKQFVLMRNTLNLGSPVLAAARMASGSMGMKYRVVPNSGIGDMSPAWTSVAANPFWLRVERRKNLISASYRTNDVSAWVTYFQYDNSTNAVFTGNTYVGFGETACNAANMQYATFSNISLIRLSGSVLLLK